MMQLEGASSDPIVDELSVLDLHDRDRDKLDWDLIWLRTELARVQAGDMHSGDDMPPVIRH